jgi:hypothetical protein
LKTLLDSVAKKDADIVAKDKALNGEKQQAAKGGEEAALLKQQLEATRKTVSDRDNEIAALKAASSQKDALMANAGDASKNIADLSTQLGQVKSQLANASSELASLKNDNSQKEQRYFFIYSPH